MAENKYIHELSEITNPVLSGFTIYDDVTTKTQKLSLENLKDLMTSDIIEESEHHRILTAADSTGKRALANSGFTYQDDVLKLHRQNNYIQIGDIHQTTGTTNSLSLFRGGDHIIDSEAITTSSINNEVYDDDGTYDVGIGFISEQSGTTMYDWAISGASFEKRPVMILEPNEFDDPLPNFVRGIKINGSPVTGVTFGTNGTSGSSGISGVDGTDGTSGTSGSSGISGVDGTDGTSGSSGISGVDGTDGTSGTSGSSGISGVDGTDGTSGTSGSSGISGVDGTDGTSGTSGSSGVSPSLTPFNGNATINGDLSITGTTELYKVSEVIDYVADVTGSQTFDFNNSNIFYITGLTTGTTWNISNVPTTNNRAISITFVIEQGATAYIPSQFQINSSNVTIQWLNNSTPSGTNNNTEVIGLVAFRVGSSWNVVGTLSTFGV